MINHKRISITAIFTMAVIFVGLLVGGCATKRDIADVNKRLDRIEEQSGKTRDMVARMDSIIAANVEASTKLRTDVRLSTEELSNQMATLLENYNYLMQVINQMAQKPDVITLPPKSSPGSQDDTLTGTQQPPPPPPQTAASSAECIDAYDSAFTLVRRGEYDAAIQGFNEFRTNCPDHENVQNAYYWIGESYYAQEKYTQAIEQYDKLVTDFPDTPRLSQALYKMARCNQELGNNDEARRLFEQVMNEHEGTLEARQSEERLKDL
ncbi:tol-pal system protein YbgF [candidate division GN15 bacterium]|nr:tol-pal system protein YbgF [candidate division GN15 bacterium]